VDGAPVGFPVWTVPKERMKALDIYREDHHVPLSSSVITMLNTIRPPNAGPDDWVFPQYRTGWTKPKAMDNDTPYKILKKIDPVVTLHGFRSCFRDWCNTSVNPNPEKLKDAQPRVEFAVAEICLAHRVGSATVRAYSRSDMLKLRRPVLEAWAEHCDEAVVQYLRVVG
jgi:integrase